MVRAPIVADSGVLHDLCGQLLLELELGALELEERQCHRESCGRG
jgi:hypothetical protein